MKPRLIFVTGPTAVGKTAVAMALAKKINAEIISCDSMQIYRGVDIISSKPAKSLRKKIPHYLIDVIAPTKEFNASKYRTYALKKAREVLKKGKVPLFVGGTGLYMSVLIDGIFEARPENKSLRRRLSKKAEAYGSQYLHKRLEKADPEAALKIHPNDTKRIIRALEVFESTGKPISELQKQRKGLADKYEVKVFCLNIERDKLYGRIEKRIERMFDDGLINEVKRLLKTKLSRTASYAIGIRELKGFLEGDYDLEEAKRLINRNTRLYAKRQLTWFRKDKRMKWINIREKDSPVFVAKRIWKELS